MNQRVVLEVYLRTRTLLSVGTGFRRGLLNPDIIVVRDEIDSLPYIPGTTLKGVLRKATAQLVPESCLSVATLSIEEPPVCGTALEQGIAVRGEPCPVCRCFGTPHMPGCIIVEDAHVVEEQREALRKLVCQRVLYTHVSISSHLGTAESGRLWTREYVPVNTIFRTRIVCLDTSKCLKMLLAGLYMLSYDHIGRAGNVKVERVVVLEGRESVSQIAKELGVSQFLNL